MSIVGKIVVFTGKISKPRHEFEKMVLDHGGKMGLAVSSSTDYLVVGEKPGSKLAAATLLGTQIINEQDFVSLLKEDKSSEEEAPLTKEQITELMTHMQKRRCKWCGEEYSQWESIPDYNTCPVCEIFARPKCPRGCSSIPTWVIAFKCYFCTIYKEFFDASYSDNAFYTEHIHIADSKGLCIVCRRANPPVGKRFMGKTMQALATQRAEEEKQKYSQSLQEMKDQKVAIKWFEHLPKAERDAIVKQVKEASSG